MRNYMLALAAVMLVAGCDNKPQSAVWAAAAAPSAQSATRPTTAPAGGAVAVTVNDRPIYLGELHDMLTKAHGLEFIQQLIASEIVAQEALAHGITIGPEDLSAEHDATLAGMFPQLTKREERDRLFDEWLRRKGLPMDLWNLTMRRNAMLTRLAQSQISVTEDAIKAEFLRRYGRQVRVRHIETDSLERAEAILSELYAGADFEKLARTRSLNPSGQESGGLLPPMSEGESGVPAAVLQAAMSLKKPGDLSNPVKHLARYHVLRLEEIIEPKDAKLDDVRKDITDSVRARMLGERKQQLLLELIQRAERGGKIEYVDPVLRKANDDAVKAAQSN
jgi:parvulin-like peptidyl-prolyl isomerase